MTYDYGGLRSSRLLIVQSRAWSRFTGTTKRNYGAVSQRSGNKKTVRRRYLRRMMCEPGELCRCCPTGPGPVRRDNAGIAGPGEHLAESIRNLWSSCADSRMDADARRPKGRHAVVPPSRTTSSRRRTVDFADPIVVPPTTPQLLKSKESVSRQKSNDSEPCFINIDRILTSNQDEHRQDWDVEDLENERLKIRDGAIEIAVDALSTHSADETNDGHLALQSTRSTSTSASSCSPQKLPGTPTYSEVEPATRMHNICESGNVSTILAHAPKHLSSTNAAALDHHGRTPLHVLSLNPSLALFDDEKMLRFVVDSLWKTYPAAIVMKDKNGCIPFQQLIKRWTDEPSQPNKNTDSAIKSNVMTRSMIWSVMKTPPKQCESRPMTSQQQKLFNSVVQKDSQASPSSSRDVERGLLFGSPMLQKLVPHHQNKDDGFIQPHLTRRVKVALVILSIIVDQSTSKMASEIVKILASTTPLLLRTIFLLSDSQDREWVLKTSIIHRVLISKHSVGRWLTSMLQNTNKLVSEGAMEYLRIVSDAALFENEKPDDMSLKSTSSRSLGRLNSRRHLLSSDTSYARQLDRQKELYSAVSRLSGFVPSLLSLPYFQMEEAATTSLVQHVLDNHISRPFAAMVVLCDAVFLFLVILGFRVGVNRLLLGYASRAVMKWLYVANTGIFYFIIRELGKAVSLCMITRRARIYFYSFWNISDLLATILAMISVVSVRGYMTTQMFINGDSVFKSLRILYAITTGFLWLRVLSFLKAINMQLATFVLAILQITRDVLWFSFILFCLVICFGQMFFTLLVPQSCDATSDIRVCAPSEYYLKVYAILLGDFGAFRRDDFTSMFSVFLLVAFSFMVVLVLLNVLIAVASDSYEKCLLRSRQLFGRARVMLIAELVSFQNLLKRSNDDTPDKVYKQWWSHYSSWGWSRGSIIFFGLSSLVVLVWVIAETSGIFSNAESDSVWMGLISIFIILTLFVCIMLFLASGANRTHDRLDRVIEEWEGGWIKHVIIRILGGSLTGEAFAKQHRSASDEAWQGRLMYLQHEMDRIARENRLEMKAHMEVLENILKQTEASVQQKLTSLEARYSNIADTQS